MIPYCYTLYLLFLASNIVMEALFSSEDGYHVFSNGNYEYFWVFIITLSLPIQVSEFLFQNYTMFYGFIHVIFDDVCQLSSSLSPGS